MKRYSPEEHSASVKMILSGPSGTGKTGTTMMLATAGYDVKIADFDAKAGGLIGPNGYIPVKAAEDHIFIQPFREKSESQSKAYKDFKKFLNDEDEGPFSWGPESVFVVDSLTKLGEAIHDAVKRDNPTAKDPRKVYGVAQDELNRLLTRLTSTDMKCHFVLLAHVEYQDLYAGQEGMPCETKGYPAGIGKAKNKLIPTVFNTMLETYAKKEKRFIRTQPSRFIVNKIPVSLDKGLKAEYPIETGMPEIFKLLGAVPPKA